MPVQPEELLNAELVVMQFLLGNVLQNSHGHAVEERTDCQALLAQSKLVSLTAQFVAVQLLCRTPLNICNQISVNISDLGLSFALTYSWPAGKKQREQCCLINRE